jgi:hypothetical protein
MMAAVLVLGALLVLTTTPGSTKTYGVDAERAKSRSGSRVAQLSGRSVPPCYCFSWCGVPQLSAFFADLPVVRSSSSPWYAYLRERVYHEEVPLPFDMGSLGWFDLPHAHRLPGSEPPHADPDGFWLPPLDHCHASGTPPGLSKPCKRAECIAAGWVRDAPSPAPLPAARPVACANYKRQEAAQQRGLYCKVVPWSWVWDSERVRRHFKVHPGRHFHVGSSLVHLHWPSIALRSRLPYRIDKAFELRPQRSLSTVISRWPGDGEPRQPGAAYSWVEVSRIQMTFGDARDRTGEGENDYGCWSAQRAAKRTARLPRAADARAPCVCPQHVRCLWASRGPRAECCFWVALLERAHCRCPSHHARSPP